MVPVHSNCGGEDLIGRRLETSTQSLLLAQSMVHATLSRPSRRRSRQGYHRRNYCYDNVHALQCLVLHAAGIRDLHSVALLAFRHGSYFGDLLFHDYWVQLCEQHSGYGKTTCRSNYPGASYIQSIQREGS